MAGIELASAYVSLIPTALNLQANTAKVLAGAVPVAEKTGVTMGTRLTAGMKAGAKGAGLAIAGVISLALYKGFQRSVAIENAQQKLSGLGHSAKAVTAIMQNSLAAVKGTAFGLDEAATVSANAVAAGIKPGKDLEKVLRLTADAATIGGTSMAEMGSIFNKVATSNKVQGDVINQLNERGIPIVQLLGKTMGKTSGEISEMSRKGEIDFAMFRRAMEEGMAGAALKSGDTTVGAWKNTMAALSRFGQALLSGIFPHFKSGLGGITKLIDTATEKVKPFAEVIGKRLGEALSTAVNWIAQLDFQKIKDFFTGVNTAGMGEDLAQIRDGFSGLGPAVQQFLAVLPKVAGAAGGVLSSAITILAKGLGWLADNIDTVVAWLPAIIAGYAAWKVATVALSAASTRLQLAQTMMAPVFLANSIIRLAAVRGEQQLALATTQTAAATNAATVSHGRAGIAMAASKVATIASTVATGAATVAQRALNLALKANPIGLVITAVGLLVGALVWFFTETEVGRKIVAAAWKGILGAVAGFVTWWKGTAQPAIDTGFKIVVAVAKIMGKGIADVWEDKVKPVFDFLVDTIKNKIPEAFRKGVDLAKNAWEVLRAVAKAPVKFVVKTVLNDGLIAGYNTVAKFLRIGELPPIKLPSGFAGGGIIPGYDSVRRDTLLTPMRKGEGVLVPEVVRALGPGFIHQLNAAGNRGGIGGVRRAVGYAGGGIIDDIGNALFSGNPLAPLVDWARREFEKKFPEASKFAGMAFSAGSKLIGGAVDFVKNKVANLFGGGTQGGFGGGGAGGSFGDYSGPTGAFHRPSYGPITSQFGAPRGGLLHAGIDIAGGGRTFAAWNGVVQKVGWNIVPGRSGIGILLGHNNGMQTYYGHNPSGGVQVGAGQLVKAGQHIGAQGATGRVTGVHLHWETWKNGRPVNPAPYLFDNGGMLPPGISVVNNKTRKPEPLGNLDKIGRGGDQYHVDQIVIPVADLRELQEVTDFFHELRRRTRQKVGSR